MAQVAGLIGTDSAATLGAAVQEAQRSTGSGGALIIGLATLLLGATGAFGQLQDALNTIWEVEPKKGGGVWRLLRSRWLSFGTLLGTGFLLMVSLTLSAGIGALVDTTSNIEWLAPYIAALDIAASLVVITCLFALIFKLLPDTKINWRDVWVGSALTAGLFVLGKFAIGFYLGVSDVGSAYGAAGSVIVIMVWIYYSAFILFFGTEFTQVWAANRASKGRSASRPDSSDDGRPSSVKSQEKSTWLGIAAALLVAWATRRMQKAPSGP